MDPLTQTLALLHPKGLAWKLAECAGDWAIRFPANGGVVFCLVAAGACQLQIAGMDERSLAEGDFVLLAGPPVWTLSDGAPVAPIDMQTARSVQPVQPEIGRATSPDAPRRIGTGRAGPVTRLLGGHFSFGDANASLLRPLLPAVVQVHSREATAGRLRAVLDLLGDEVASERAGRTLMLDRLLEIMLVEAIRHGALASGTSDVFDAGLLAGLADPQVAPALRAMHADVRRAWTVAQLADVAGSSRSVFAERFRSVVGLAPIDYLLQWRMALAKDALRAGRARLSEIAFACGYQSTSAFSTAFRRIVGRPPARYAAEMADASAARH
ncbi:MAG: AraC family transcriptional regulator [Pseudomonadota bacterium]